MGCVQAGTPTRCFLTSLKDTAVRLSVKGIFQSVPLTQTIFVTSFLRLRSIGRDGWMAAVKVNCPLCPAARPVQLSHFIPLLLPLQNHNKLLLDQPPVVDQQPPAASFLSAFLPASLLRPGLVAFLLAASSLVAPCLLCCLSLGLPSSAAQSIEFPSLPTAFFVSGFQQYPWSPVMSGVARKRLIEERKSWRKDHPIGFWARPEAGSDGSSNMFSWKAGIPGKEGTDWEGGVYLVSMEFSDEYPARPPRCKSNQESKQTVRVH